MTKTIKYSLLWLMLTSMLYVSAAQGAEKSRVWVVNDLVKGPNGDEDDDVTMAALLLLADHYTIEGITVHAATIPVEDTATWAKETFIADYKKEVGQLNAHYGNQYQLDVPVYMAGTASKKFLKIQNDVLKPSFLNKNMSIDALLRAADKGTLHVLNWGPLTEVAMIIKYAVENKKTNALKNIKFVSHWTQRGGPWNCAADNEACNYVHDQAESNPNVVLYELGPSGQRGMVENKCNTSAKLDPQKMFASKIGKHMSAKWLKCRKCNGMADMSDGATIFVTIGLGGGLEAYESNGTTPEQDKMNNLLCQDRNILFSKLEERALVAAQ